MESKNNNIVPKNEGSNVVKYEIENIKNLIYTIRGKQVMLDSDVALLYNYKTKVLNLSVRRNIEIPRGILFSINRRGIFELEVSN